MNNSINHIKAPSYTPDLNRALPPQKEETNFSASDSVSIGTEYKSEINGSDPKKWTVLHYGAADNNISSSIINNALELESIGSDKNINIVAQLDVGEKPPKGYEMDAGCKRYYFKSPTESFAIPLESEQINMADPKVLADFVEWGIKNYPAENYMLIMSSHGKGWEGMIVDRSHKGFMSTPEIREALESAKNSTGKKIDVIGFDACSMASVEVAAELSDVADYMVASQNTTHKSGWSYSKIFSDSGEYQINGSNSSFNFSPEEAAKKLVEASISTDGIQTLSALELSKINLLTESTANFTKELKSGIDNKSLIKKLAKESKTFHSLGKYRFIDQYDFASKISQSSDIKNKKLKEAAVGMMESIKSLVISEYHNENFEGANGISIEMSSNGLGTERYNNLLFAKETLWNEANADKGIKKLWNSLMNFLED